MKTYKGYFRPKNPKKYIGNSDNIIYRSSWEAKLMKYLDEHPNVLSWASEEIYIPYLSPVDGKMHRYFPDFYVKLKNKNKIIENLLIEVKPEAQTKPPKAASKKSTKFIKESITYAVNDAKWKAAKSFCEERQWKFVIMTEYQLGITDG